MTTNLHNDDVVQHKGKSPWKKVPEHIQHAFNMVSTDIENYYNKYGISLPLIQKHKRNKFISVRK